MPLSENPYESPRIPDAALTPQDAQPRHGWKFVLLGIAIGCGVVSLAPWLGVLFALISAPVFLRYFVYGWKRPHITRWEYAASQAAGTLGGVGFAISVVAAAAGAFYGTCTLTSWSIALPTMSVTRGEGAGYALVAGVVVGVAAGVMSLLWLIRFYYVAADSD